MIKKVLFVSQDPGSGNALYLVIKELLKKNNIEVVVFATRHSKNIFKDQMIEFKDMDDKPFELDFKPDLIITGASAGNCIEKEAILWGKAHKVKTISILDFWANYKYRYDDIIHHIDFKFMPDYIFVMDDIAKQRMLKEGFPEDKLIITGNPYFDTFKAKALPSKNSILYISQPTRINNKYVTDLVYLGNIISILKNLDSDLKITLRAHPKEDKHVFEKFLQTKNYSNVIFDDNMDIKKSVESNSIIIGKHSMVLFEAVFSNRVVISYQPKKEVHDRLITNELGLSCLASNPEELAFCLKHSLNELNKKRQVQVFKYYNDSKSTQRVLKEIYNQL
jgi:hypothetical protein